MLKSDVKKAVERVLEDHQIDDRELAEDLVDAVATETAEVVDDDELDPTEEDDL